MSITVVREYFKQYNLDDRIHEYPTSSATVELAAEAAGVIPARICKTLSFRASKDNDTGAILVCTAGDTKIDNKKFKEQFGLKAKMLSPEEVLAYTNHEVGGVCPFGVGEDAHVYCDISMKRFESVFPACGSSNSAIELSIDELYRYSNSIGWIDVCKGWQEEDYSNE